MLKRKKQEFVMKNTNLKPTVLYCNTTIKQILDSERRPFYQLPRVIEQMLVYLYNKGCTTHGLFREVSSASAKEIDEIFHRMSVTDFEDLPPDVVANVLKKFLRELKEKVFKFDMSSFMLTEWQRNRAKKRTSNADKRQIVLTALKKTPPEHVTMLRSLLKLCNKIDSMSDINAMTNKNLAVCLAPTLMTLSQDTSSKTMDLKTGGEIVGCIEIVTFIFNDFIHLFPEDVDDNVTRRSRRMSQRLVTCLVEGMNEEEKIFKGIVEAKQSKDPSKANATEQEAEAERTKVPEELLIEIRNPTSPHPKISPRKMPQKPSAPISVSPVNKPASSQFLRTNPTSNQDSIVPSVHLIGTKKDIDSKDQLQKQNSPRKPPPRKLPPVPHPQAKTLPQGFTNPHHPPRTALNDDSSQQQVSENIGDTTSDNVGDAVVGNYTVDNPPPVPPRRNPMRTSNSNSQGTSPRQETL
ncbi:T-cell activation Rho GTPase activating protein [Entamoeba marina]